MLATAVLIKYSFIISRLCLNLLYLRYSYASRLDKVFSASAGELGQP